MPNRRQAFTWTNADPIHWRIHAALGGYKLNVSTLVFVLGTLWPMHVFSNVPFDSLWSNMFTSSSYLRIIPRYIARLTLWGRVTHICVGKLTIIGSDNGLSPGRRQAIIWTNARILLIRPSGTTFSDIVIGFQTFLFKKINFKMSVKWRFFPAFFLGSIC